MWRVSLLALALALALVPARAGAERDAAERGAATAERGAGTAERDAATAEVHAGARAALARQLTDELDAVTRARAAVDDKLAEADAARGRRLAAAYRLLKAPHGRPAGDPEARMAAARRRAAARLLLDRDLAERALLADEAAQLRAADDELRATAARVPLVALPTELGRPARGELVRRFGTIAHERSKTTLARRGLDFEVEERAHAVAPAAGTVRYAGPIRGLDAGVVIDHGGYLTVVAKLGALTVPVGAPVRRGDRVGRAARRRVYLELRVKLGAGGLPIDPEPLFGARTDRTDHSDRPEPGPPRSDRSDRSDRSARTDRSDRSDRSDRPRRSAPAQPR